MPDWKPEILRRLTPLKLSPSRETEIAEEIGQHLDDRYKDLLADGLSTDSAFRAAARRTEGRRPARAQPATSRDRPVPRAPRARETQQQFIRRNSSRCPLFLPHDA